MSRLWWLPPVVSWTMVVVQVYFIVRSVRNWKESDKELQEARRLRREALDAYLEAMRDLQSVQPGLPDEQKPPTVQ